MSFAYQPTTLVPRSDAWNAHHFKRAPAEGRGGFVLYAGGEPVGMGFIPELISAGAGLLSQVIGGNQEAKNQKRQMKYALEAEKVKAESARYAIDSVARAEANRASAETEQAMIEAEAATSALRTQRAAAIDAQATQLVSNTQNGIFRLSSVGLSESGSVTRAAQSKAMWGVFLVTAAVLIAMNPPKLRRKEAA